MTESVAGKLLVASPEVGDFFHRSVVLVVEHNEEGAFGLTLNRPSERTVAEVVPELSDLIEADSAIYLGGPVSPNSLTCIGEFTDSTESERLIVGAVGMVDLDASATLERVKLFAGYAGWAPGQLDFELDQEGWGVTEPSAEDPFAEGDLWVSVLRRLGGEYELLSRFPEDPSVN